MKSGMPRLAKTYQPYLSLTAGSQTTHAVSLDTGTNRLREAGDTSHVRVASAGQPGPAVWPPWAGHRPCTYTLTRGPVRDPGSGAFGELGLTTVSFSVVHKSG